MKNSAVYMAFAACILAFSLLADAQIAPVSTVPLVYPLKARAEGIEGRVVLKGTLSKEGKMENLHVLSGPPELQQAAVDVVRKWSYKPYKHFGRIVEVDNTITINFSMGDAKHKAEVKAKAQAELDQSSLQNPPQESPQPDQPKQ